MEIDYLYAIYWLFFVSNVSYLCFFVKSLQRALFFNDETFCCFRNTVYLCDPIDSCL